MENKNNHWWQNAVGYQIYPKSFKDTNDDGIGDIQGIIQQLPYLKELGVDFLWINPLYQSPNVDHGYDISDFRAVQEEFGTIEDLKELLEKAHRLDIKILMDLVVNHTSDQHPWFIKSRKSKDNPYRNYYHWVDATPEKCPNDWQSFFGGSTWEYDEATNQAYFHIFYKEQPDLNWKNEKMRQEIYEMIRFWLDLGIDGFRLDAISHIQKEDWNFQITDNQWAPFMNVNGIEQYMSELKEIFSAYDILTVGEASGVTSKKARQWTNENGYINMIFELEHNHRKGVAGYEKMDILGYKKTMARWQKDLAHEGWNALYIENHDNPRMNTVMGNETEKSAKAIATAYLLLKGTPFIYQGQELGMTNTVFETIGEMDDLSDKHRYQLLVESGVDEKLALQQVSNWSRDHSRTPMQWSDAENAGFTNGKSWLKTNPSYKKINVEHQKNDEHSVFNYYKKLIALRKSEETLTFGAFELLLAHDEDTFIYLRKTEEKEILVLTNLSEKVKKITLPNKITNKNWQLLLSNTNEQLIQKHFEMNAFDAFVFERSMKQGK
ncbi:alpha-glucosidase [Pilibacter termitis]|uniref:Alpha-amylase n=1 Tax=Pilibacter termitis TaxID=263852 RepID=A0A1T4ME06_9ENTE|nr:alpha-glucosidase [Pilibacter termitis]SJZ65087.1 alpha-glucosidase [Pilibacter termitis]